MPESRHEESHEYGEELKGFPRQRPVVKSDEDVVFEPLLNLHVPVSCRISWVLHGFEVENVARANCVESLWLFLSLGFVTDSTGNHECLLAGKSDKHNVHLYVHRNYQVYSLPPKWL